MDAVYADNFSIIKKLGQGGMGEVFLASHSSLGEVAVKIIEETTTNNIRRFLREAKITASLQHDNIVRVHQIGETENSFYLAMEYLQGLTLDKRICYSTVPEDLAWKICEQICAGLSFAWSKKIIHRDIKPENIFLTNDNTAKLMDFGISKYYDEHIQITKTGAILGTPLYISPEQANGQAVDCRSDIYSLGVSMYEAITGVVPFQGENILDIIYKHRFEPPKDPNNYVPSITKNSRKIIAKMLQKQQMDRYQKYEEILDDIKLMKSNKSLKYADEKALQIYDSRSHENVVQFGNMEIDRFSDNFSTNEQLQSKILLVSDNKLQSITMPYAVISSQKKFSEEIGEQDIIFLDIDFLGLHAIDWVNFLKKNYSSLYIVILTSKTATLQEPFVKKSEIERYMLNKRIWNIFQVKDLYILDILCMMPDTSKKVVLDFHTSRENIKISIKQSVVEHNNEQIAFRDHRLQKTFKYCKIYSTTKETQNTTIKIDTRLEQGELRSSLEEAMNIEGALAAALVDVINLRIIMDLGHANFDVCAAALGNVEVVKAKKRVMKELQLCEEIEDILITLDTQYHLIRTFHQNSDIFLYLVLDKSKINLTLARRQLKMIERQLQFPVET